MRERKRKEVPRMLRTLSLPVTNSCRVPKVKGEAGVRKSRACSTSSLARALALSGGGGACQPGGLPGGCGGTGGRGGSCGGNGGGGGAGGDGGDGGGL